MTSIKPNKPRLYEGKRDEFAVRTWLYQVKQYLALIQVGQENQLSAETKISFAATYFSGTAAAWWYTLVGAGTIPTTWEAFESVIIQEFVPFDSVQRSRDKLRRLVQRTSVTSYLAEFRNIVLTIPGMSEGDRVDRFCQGLKPNIRLEVLKAGAQTMNEASRIALNVDSALFGAGMFNFQQGGGFTRTQYAPMEIGNIEQRDKDRKKNACFTCHKVGCRPWLCGNGRGAGQDSRRRRPGRISNSEVKDCGKGSSLKSEN